MTSSGSGLLPQTPKLPVSLNDPAGSYMGTGELNPYPQEVCLIVWSMQKGMVLQRGGLGSGRFQGSFSDEKGPAKRCWGH